MPLLEQIHEEAPESSSGKNGESSNVSSPSISSSTPITNSTPSSTPNSFHSGSPEASALFRLISIPQDSDIEYHFAFPREQTLLDILLQSSGVENIYQLRQLHEVRLRVVASAISLSRLEIFTPYIRILRLDGSGLTSLREIGTTLNHLRVLHVSKCGLTNLDGTFGLMNLTELYAADNHIENVGPCAILENIKVINLDRNPLNSIGNVSLLSLCPHLKKLSMKGTPVAKAPGYRKIIKDLIPNLKKLDGDFVNDEDSIEESNDEESYRSIDGNLKPDNTSSCSIEVSSLSEPSSEDNENNWPLSNFENNASQNNIISHKIELQRPATATGLVSTFSVTKTARRPCTALPKMRDVESSNSPIFPDSSSDTSPSSLTSGGIVCGNIARALARARPPQKPLKPSSSKPLDPWVIGPSDNDKNSDLTQPETIPGCSKSDDKQICDQVLKSTTDLKIDDHLNILEEAKKIINEPLPSKPLEATPVVDLELGITGTISSSSNINAESKWEDCSEKALNISMQWRKAFKLYRKKHKISTVPESNESNVNETTNK